MKRIVPILFFLGIAAACHAQQWDEASLNRPENIMYDSWNPVRLSWNSMTDFSTGVLSWEGISGDFHNVNEASKSHNLDVRTSGLKKIGKFHLSGMIGYDNLREKDMIWNSTLWLDERNPFSLGDTVSSKRTVESFHVQAGASYALSEKISIGADIKLDFGTLSDQEDPRPKTHTSVIPIRVGMQYGIGNGWTVGLSAGAELYNSNIQYTIINAQVSYRYFLMKGMGDYLSRSSASESSYTRNYSGTTWSGSLNAAKRGERFSNFAELRFSYGKQKATDGGSMYEFKGGDYGSTSVEAYDRIQFVPGRNAMHNLSVSFSYSSGNADWYDQTREVDTEHGNRTYYRVLAKSKVQDQTSWDAHLGYRLDLTETRFYAAVNGCVADDMFTHYLGTSSPEQELMNVSADVKVGKYFGLGKCTLLTEVGGLFRTPVTTDYTSGSSTSGDSDITTIYDLPKYEYYADRKAGVDALADISIPVSKQMTLGLFANFKWVKCLGYEIADYFDSETRTYFRAGAYLNF